MTIIGRNEGLSNPPDRAEPPAMPNPSADQAQQCTRLARCCASTRRARELASATPRASHPARRRLTARPLAVRFSPLRTSRAFAALGASPSRLPRARPSARFKRARPARPRAMPSYGTNDERGAGAWTNIAEEAEHGGDGTKEPVVNVYTKLKDQRQCSACSLWGRRRFFGDWEWREAAPRCWKCVKAKRAAKDAAFHKGRPDFVKQNSVKTGLALNRPKKQAESAYSAAKLAADRPTLNRDPSSASNPGADPDRTHGRASVSFDDAALPGLPPVRRAKPAGPPKPYDPDAGVPEVRRSTLYPGAGYRPSSRSQSERLGGAPSPLYRRSDRSDRRANTAASASASAFASLPNSERRASASTSASASARLSRDFPGGSSDPRRDRRSTNATSARDASTPCEDSGSRTSSSAASREGTPPSTRPPRPSTRPPRPSPRPRARTRGSHGQAPRRRRTSTRPATATATRRRFPAGGARARRSG